MTPDDFLARCRELGLSFAPPPVILPPAPAPSWYRPWRREDPRKRHDRHVNVGPTADSSGPERAAMLLLEGVDPYYHSHPEDRAAARDAIARRALDEVPVPADLRAYVARSDAPSTVAPVGELRTSVGAALQDAARRAMAARQ